MIEKMERLELKDEEITYEKMKEILNGLFYSIRDLHGKTDEDRDLLCDCLDGSPKGVTGVQMLMAYLTGTSYDLVTHEDGSRDYEKRAPTDPKEIYIKANELIDLINTIDVEEKEVSLSKPKLEVSDDLVGKQAKETTGELDYKVTSKDLAEISKERVGTKMLRKIKEFFNKIRNHDTNIGGR